MFGILFQNLIFLRMVFTSLDILVSCSGVSAIDLNYSSSAFIRGCLND